MSKQLLPIIHHSLYSAPKLVDNHRFPMAVFQRIADTIRSSNLPCQFYQPPRLPTREELILVHDKDYVAAFLQNNLDDVRLRKIGFGQMNQTLIDRTLAEVAGTRMTATLALHHGLACNTAGGTHHAFPSFGSGYCIINDLAITAELLIKEDGVKRVLIVDLDVHQGDGTAAIFNHRKDVFTFSMHAASNFPSRKQQSHLDIALPDGTEDDEYLGTLAKALKDILTSFKPSIVLYDAGVDVHKDDALGRLALTDDGILRRELLVLDTCLGAEIPVAGFVGGGYDDDLDILSRRHLHLHRAATELWSAHGLY